MIRVPKPSLASPIAVAVVALAATVAAWAQPPAASLEAVLGTTGEIDPGGPVNVFKVTALLVDSNNEYAVVFYTQQTDNGPIRDRFAWIFLSNDRKINYKMSMLALLRDAMDDPARHVGISIVPATQNTSRPTVAAVSLGPRSS